MLNADYNENECETYGLFCVRIIFVKKIPRPHPISCYLTFFCGLKDIKVFHSFYRYDLDDVLM